MCILDPATVTLAYTTTTPYLQGSSVTANIDVEIENQSVGSPANDILSAAGPNYAFQLSLTNADLQTMSATLVEIGVNLNIVSDLTVGLTAGGASVVFSGTVDFTLPTVSCNSFVYLCVELSLGGSAAYVDVDATDTSNAMCVSVTDNIYCVPGKMLCM